MSVFNEVCEFTKRLLERARLKPRATPEPCGCFKGMTKDGRGCQRPVGHDGDCRPFHEPDPAEWGGKVMTRRKTPIQ